MLPAVSSTAATGSAGLPAVALLGIRLHALTEAQVVAHVMDELAAGRGGFVATANLDHLRRLQQPGAFRSVYEQATVVVADGMPLVWACRLQGTPIPGRVPGSDLIRSLPAAATRAGRSVFLLGGDAGTADAAAAELMKASPGLRIAGTTCPPFGFEREEARMLDLRRTLAAARPDLVFVALGSPKQELLIAELRSLLPRAWWVGVGISFSFVAGDVRRAPRWMQRLGIEWLHRLVQEPRRLLARYVWHGLPFAVVLFAKAIAARLRGRRRA